MPITEAEFLWDYIDGQIVERSLSTLPHGRVQGRFSVLFHSFTGLFAFPELQIGTIPRHYRTVDVAVYRDQEPVSDIPDEAPFIAIEVVSPEDALDELTIKLSEYKEIGVVHIWIVSPRLLTLYVFDNGSLLRVDAFQIPEFDLRFTAADLLY